MVRVGSADYSTRRKGLIRDSGQIDILQIGRTEDEPSGNVFRFDGSSWQTVNGNISVNGLDERGVFDPGCGPNDLAVVSSSAVWVLHCSSETDCSWSGPATFPFTLSTKPFSDGDGTTVFMASTGFEGEIWVANLCTDSISFTKATLGGDVRSADSNASSVRLPDEILPTWLVFGGIGASDTQLYLWKLVQTGATTFEWSKPAIATPEPYGIPIFAVGVWDADQRRVWWRAERYLSGTKTHRFRRPWA
ncbi:MAG: hypothetical protein R3A47_06680 [Polyangiales bacterium]